MTLVRLAAVGPTGRGGRLSLRHIFREREHHSQYEEFIVAIFPELVVTTTGFQENGADLFRRETLQLPCEAEKAIPACLTVLGGEPRFQFTDPARQIQRTAQGFQLPLQRLLKGVPVVSPLRLPPVRTRWITQSQKLSRFQCGEVADR